MIFLDRGCMLSFETRGPSDIVAKEGSAPTEVTRFIAEPVAPRLVVTKRMLIYYDVCIFVYKHSNLLSLLISGFLF